MVEAAVGAVQRLPARAGDPHERGGPVTVKLQGRVRSAAPDGDRSRGRGRAGDRGADVDFESRPLAAVERPDDDLQAVPDHAAADVQASDVDTAAGAASVV